MEEANEMFGRDSLEALRYLLLLSGSAAPPCQANCSNYWQPKAQYRLSHLMAREYRILKKQMVVFQLVQLCH
jgi:hypothetical protein